MDIDWLKEARVGIVIPTFMAGQSFTELLSDLANQTLQPKYRLVIDSCSTDNTVQKAKNAWWQTYSLPKESFGHGKTRQKALLLLMEQSNLDYVIYLTQDVRIPAKDSLEKLLLAFRDEQVACAYGRQVPHKNASIYAAVDREFNYPGFSKVKTIQDKNKLGIKTAFFSNSYAAYRVSDLVEQGGFSDLECCEDVDMAGRFLLRGKKIAYVADAEVEHSHEPHLKSQWKRYRAIGRFYKSNNWLQEKFGDTSSEGYKLLRYQLQRIGKEKGICGVIKILTLDAIRFIAYKTS